MAYNKVIYNGITLVDLTGDSITAEHVLGDTFHGKDGESYSGTMTNRGNVTGTIASKDDSYTIQKGYHGGSGTVQLSQAQKNLLVSGNIKQGVTLLGVLGSYAGETPSYETKTKTYTPSATTQSETLTAGSGYDAIGSVAITVNPIPYTESANTYGTTVTIG